VESLPTLQANPILTTAIIVNHYAVREIVMDMMTKAVQKDVPNVKVVLHPVLVLRQAPVLSIAMMDTLVKPDVPMAGVIV